MTTTIAFGGLQADSGDGVIVPRPWTVAQSRWAADIATRLPAGPIVELCAGCGAIGLEAARRSGRSVVLVDDSAEACRWAARNVAVNGLGHRAEIRQAGLDRALLAGERFPLILADPPYVPTGEVGRYPGDPPSAIDGGRDGLDRLREIVKVIDAHLLTGGAALVQVRGGGQAGQVRRLAATAAPRLRAGAVRVYGEHRAIIELRAIRMTGRRA